MGSLSRVDNRLNMDTSLSYPHYTVFIIAGLIV